MNKNPQSHIIALRPWIAEKFERYPLVERVRRKTDSISKVGLGEL